MSARPKSCSADEPGASVSWSLRHGVAAYQPVSVRRWHSPEELAEIGLSRSRVLMVNEAHDSLRRCIRTRHVGARMIEPAHAAGVRHLAMEALTPDFAAAANHDRRLGSGDGYTAQPELRELMTVALELGWSLIAYEAGAPPGDPHLLSTRKSRQAQHQRTPELVSAVSCGLAKGGARVLPALEIPDLWMESWRTSRPAGPGSTRPPCEPGWQVESRHAQAPARHQGISEPRSADRTERHRQRPPEPSQPVAAEGAESAGLRCRNRAAARYSVATGAPCTRPPPWSDRNRGEAGSGRRSA